MSFPIRFPRWLGRPAVLTAAVCMCGTAQAVKEVMVEVGGVQGDGWRVAAGRAVVEPQDGALALRLSIPELQLEGEQPPVARSIELSCGDVVLNREYLVCERARAGFRLRGSEEPLQAEASFVLRRADGRWRASGSALVGADALDWSLSGGPDGLRADLRAASLALDPLVRRLPHLPEWLASSAGALEDVHASVELPAQGPAAMEFRVAGAGLGFDSLDGRTAAAGVELELEGHGRLSADGWEIGADARVASGEFLVGALYTRIGDAPVAVSLRTRGAAGVVEVESYALEDPGTVSVAGSGRWDMDGGAKSLQVQQFSAEFPGFFERYLQSVLAQYGFGELALEGSVSGGLDWSEGSPRAFELALENVNITDARDRLEMSALDGRLQWRAEGEPLASRLAWQSGKLYRIPLGGVEVRVESAGDSLRLTQAVGIPILDGTLLVHEFMVEEWLAEEAELLFDAELESVSLARMSEVLEWPPLSGAMSGRIPALTYEGGVYRIGGLLEVEVFDGRLLVENLRLERPLGVLPKMEADIELHDLDLELLTGTFAFGRITGRLGGYVRELRLLDWRPVHFVAALGTPEADRSRKRISQRAVDTLTAMGGAGAAGAVQRTFLRMFEDFGYRRLGLKCRLDDDVCIMDGAGPAPDGGYYIVEGRGIPRVDVIGQVRRVNWRRLISQLIQATQGTPPTVGGRPEQS